MYFIYFDVSMKHTTVGLELAKTAFNAKKAGLFKSLGGLELTLHLKALKMKPSTDPAFHPSHRQQQAEPKAGTTQLSRPRPLPLCRHPPLSLLR